MPRRPITASEMARRRWANTGDDPAEVGAKGGKQRAANLTPERRSEIAKAAAQKRWAEARKHRCEVKP